ncbi:MAG: T9SS type A sorting domain-containing protein [Saprospiraceae bacterium]|nr:T9SS type A sorting domain-containing protein [Saprospiraceae bacterium]
MKKSLLIVFVLFISISIFAQPSLTDALMPSPWDITDLHPADTAFVNHGPSGPNQTWDFSTVNVHFNPQGYYYYPPAYTLYDSAFPTATVALEIALNPFNYLFYETSTTEYVLLGEWSDIWQLPYSDTKKALSFPFTYNSTITDTYGGTSAPYSGTAKTITGNFTTTADGYGTLILPSATHNNVLRLKTIDHYTESYTGPDTPVVYDFIRYEWYDCVNKFPLLSIVSFTQTVGSSVSSLKQVLLSTFAAGLEEPKIDKNEFSLFPNPAIQSTNMSILLIEKSKVEISVYSIMGQLVKRLPTKEYSPGIINEELDLKGLSKGNYFVRAKINDGYLLEKLIVQ